MKLTDVVTFGKYKGKTWREIYDIQPSYLIWIHWFRAKEFPYLTGEVNELANAWANSNIEVARKSMGSAIELRDRNAKVAASIGTTKSDLKKVKRQTSTTSIEDADLGSTKGDDNDGNYYDGELPPWEVDKDIRSTSGRTAIAKAHVAVERHANWGTW